MGINICGLNKNHSFKDTLIRGQWSYQYNVLFEIALQWTLNFMDQLTNGIDENWSLMNIDETTVIRYILQWYFHFNQGPYLQWILKNFNFIVKFLLLSCLPSDVWKDVLQSQWYDVICDCF